MKPFILCHPGSKRPIGNDWGKNTLSADDLEKRLATKSDLNVGVLLGPTTFIDIECDSDDASAHYSELFSDVKTPCWSSKRGQHHLFLYDSRLADLPGSVKLPSKLEFRLGNGKQIQSIIPPSIVDGVRRDWIVSMDECEPAAVPEHVIELLLSLPRETKGERRAISGEPPSSELIHRAINYVAHAQTGLTDGRKNAAFSLAGHLLAFVDDTTGGRLSEDQIVDLLRPWNMQNMPPLSDDTLREKVHNGVTYTPRPDKVVEQSGNLGEMIHQSSLSHAASTVSQTELQYVPFPVQSLPRAVADYVQAASESIGCDPAYIALPLLACLGRAIGNKRVIRLKKTWCESAIIWAAIVGESGTHKSPAMKLATHFLQSRQSTIIQRHNEALEQFEQDKKTHDANLLAWKKAAKDGNVQPRPIAPREPKCDRYTTTDGTVEAVASLLSKQSDGLLVIRDELAGWLGGMAEYKGGRGSDLGHWLSFWSAEPVTIDRKTSKTIHIPRASVGIVGGIQPAILRNAIGREHMHDGLCARLLLAMPEGRTVRWNEQTVDNRTESRMADVFERVLAIETRDKPFDMPLSSAGKMLWVEYFNRHRAELTGLGSDLRAAWSKLEAYTARFALIFQLVEGGDEIDAVAMRLAIQLSDWFGGEARRVYAMLASCTDQFGDLIELIANRGSRITSGELMAASRKYRGHGTAKAALDDLARVGRGKWEGATFRLSV